MTDRSKFEQMLEHLISEDEVKAKELFHEIVVEKSREIYETLLSEDFQESDMSMPTDADDMPAAEAMGGDAGDKFISDVESDDEEGDDDMMDIDDMGDDDMGDDDMGGDENVEDRLDDLEAALDELKDEFESLMSSDDDMGDDDMGMGDDDMGMGDDDMGMGDDDMGDDEEPLKNSMSDEQFIREYTEKVTAKMGDNGANTKSIVAKANNMGGSAKNLNQSFEEKGKGGTAGGLANPSTKQENFGNVNVPGGKAGVKHLKNVPAGHGAEKKGSKPDSEKSLLGR
jgi:hypothetical protein